jgi:hypothetical protein
MWVIPISLILGFCIGMYVESYLNRQEERKNFAYEGTPIGDAVAREYLDRDN